MSEEEVVLPTEKVAPESQDPDILILYGPPKVGKTTLVSELESNCILDLENGTKYLEAIKIHINELADLNKYGPKIAKEKPYNFVTIDPISRLETLVKEEAKQMYKATEIGKNFEGDDILSLPRGAGYYWLRQAYMKWLEKIKKLAPHIILVGHLKTSVDNKDGKEVQVKDLDLTGKIKDITCQEADAIGYLYRGEDSSLNVSFKSEEDILCGARPEHLKGQDMEVADYDPENNQLVDVAWNKIYKHVAS